MKIMIIEDEHHASELLKKMLNQTGEEIEITGVFDSIEDSIEYLKDNKPDLIFADIEISDGISFEIFEETNCKIPVIFTTAYNEYAIRGFKLNSIDYLLKPIDPDELKNALDKFKELYIDKNSFSIDKLLNYFSDKKSYRSIILVNSGAKTLPVSVEDIAYFYLKHKLVYFRLFNNEEFSIDITLDELENSLNPSKFFRINRQEILSIKSVLYFEEYFNRRLLVEVKPESKEQIIVSKRKVPLFKIWLEGNFSDR